MPEKVKLLDVARPALYRLFVPEVTVYLVALMDQVILGNPNRVQ